MLRSFMILLAAALSAQVAIAEQPTEVSGKAVFEYWCAPCHAPGPGHPGTQSLQLKYQGKLPAVLLDRTDLSRQAVAVFVRQGILLMAPFRKTEITDAQLDALSAYVAGKYQAH
ncbi:MAG TPA: cytochrome c [Steroidobacteraceae bacterium]|nr:cytochrome c [Steroidobacteraceae bacterium]